MLLDSGQEVSALSRRPATATRPGLHLYPADLDDVQPLPALSGQLIYTAPPPRQGKTDPRMRALLRQADAVRRIVYISTSGVYGDCGGAWVDEDRPPAPLTERAHRRLDAERLLQAWARKPGRTVVILRVPGIYGPGRLPVDRLRRGLPVLDPAEAPWSNRIHAEDLARACCQALERGEGVYNLSDGQPASMSDYFLACARHLHLPAPPLLNWAEAEQQFSPALMSFYRESRRLKIDRARHDLGFTPMYPDLASGLRQSEDEQ